MRVPTLLATLTQAEITVGWADAVPAITTIIATTVNNTRMRLIMRYPLSVKGGTRQPRLTLHNEATLASGDESTMNSKGQT
jgi:hypothetical protein